MEIQGVTIELNSDTFFQYTLQSCISKVKHEDIVLNISTKNGDFVLCKSEVFDELTKSTGEGE